MDGDLEKIREQIEQFTIEGDLRRAKPRRHTTAWTSARDRGFRHRRGLPMRGERTRDQRTGAALRRIPPCEP